jgi:hypothetical protein
MTCIDLEILLCDYVDGTLDNSRKSEVEEHLGGCAACAELAKDAAAAVSFMERAASVEPPPELMTRILFEVHAGKPRASKKPSWLKSLFDPILQPRFVMGMAMTILSFSMLGRFANVPVRYLTAADLEPAKIWLTVEHKVNRGWLAVVKYYESLRFVYEIQSRLREWSEEDQELNSGQEAADQSGTGSAQKPQVIDSNDRRLNDDQQPAGASGPDPANQETERPRRK